MRTHSHTQAQLEAESSRAFYGGNARRVDEDYKRRIFCCSQHFHSLRLHVQNRGASVLVNSPDMENGK